MSHLTRLEYSLETFEKYSNTKLYEICPVGAELSITINGKHVNSTNRNSRH
jgi:hypothetical protein